MPAVCILQPIVRGRMELGERERMVLMKGRWTTSRRGGCGIVLGQNKGGRRRRGYARSDEGKIGGVEELIEVQYSAN